MRRLIVRSFLIAALLGLAVIAYGYREATSAPIVRRTVVALADWPEGAPPIDVLLISDTHAGGPDMPLRRLEAIVAQANALKPDLVLLAGDYISDKRSGTFTYPTPVAVQPFSGLRAPLGAYAVIGNHDHWRDADATRKALEANGVTVLDNEAARVGPLALGGIGDDFTLHDDLGRTLARMAPLPGAKLLLSHGPDLFARVPPKIGLMLAGHTHCGQIVLPLIGPLTTASRHGNRYACGIVQEEGKTLIVTAGIGTSVLPLRIGAPPDMWLVRLHGPEATARD